MGKIILALLLSVFCMFLFASQLDQQLAMHSLFQTKNALNRAVHAGAQRVDMNKLAQGIRSIDESEATQTIMDYLQANLSLDESLTPKPGSFLQAQIEIVQFEIMNDTEIFPRVYQFPDHAELMEIERPAIALQILVEYPRTFNVMSPIQWEIRSIAELSDPYGIKN